MIAQVCLTGSAVQRSRLTTGMLMMNLNGSGRKKLMLFAGMVKEAYLC